MVAAVRIGIWALFEVGLSCLELLVAMVEDMGRAFARRVEDVHINLSGNPVDCCLHCSFQFMVMVFKELVLRNSLISSYCLGPLSWLDHHGVPYLV